MDAGQAAPLVRVLDRQRAEAGSMRDPGHVADLAAGHVADRSPLYGREELREAFSTAIEDASRGSGVEQARELLLEALPRGVREVVDLSDHRDATMMNAAADVGLTRVRGDRQALNRFYPGVEARQVGLDQLSDKIRGTDLRGPRDAAPIDVAAAVTREVLGRTDATKTATWTRPGDGAVVVARQASAGGKHGFDVALLPPGTDPAAATTEFRRSVSADEIARNAPIDVDRHAGALRPLVRLLEDERRGRTTDDYSRELLQLAVARGAGPSGGETPAAYEHRIHAGVTSALREASREHGRPQAEATLARWLPTEIREHLRPADAPTLGRGVDLAREHGRDVRDAARSFETTPTRDRAPSLER